MNIQIIIEQLEDLKGQEAYAVLKTCRKEIIDGFMSNIFIECIS